MAATFQSHVMRSQDYYAKVANNTDREHLGSRFQNIDDEDHFAEYMHRLTDSETRNFVLDFGNEDAYCAVNLRSEEFKRLLSEPRAKCFGTRWINLWSPEEQHDTIKAIVSTYGVSERLQGMMCTKPVFRPPKPTPSATKRHPQHDVDVARDLENAFPLKGISDQDASHDPAASQKLTFAQVTDQIWHFSSVDHGPRYTCVGYNTLYVIPGLPKEKAENGKDVPEGKRLWSWLILCDDGTVISIQENPYPQIQHFLRPDQRKVLDIARRNVRFIFSGVSKQHLNMSESDSLVTIRVRHFSGVGPDQANIKQEDGPSLLFYYIFDDWVSSYGLIAKREHTYGVALEDLRSQMLHRPVVDLVNELHWLGRRLAVLKRLYQSYELIMRRILQRQKSLRDEARSSHPSLIMGATSGEIELGDMGRSAMLSNDSVLGTNDKPVGVLLSSAAVARFERLIDRINLYCLSEIETCLLEKESLTFLNFNLIALKDSQAVEKLTRITILLAKATMLFLPVSLMTGYFSTELQGVKGGYTKVDYWASFGVIFFVTILTLTVFGYASDTVEGKTIYRSLAKTFFRSSRDRFTQPRRAGRNEI